MVVRFVVAGWGVNGGGSLGPNHRPLYQPIDINPHPINLRDAFVEQEKRSALWLAGPSVGERDERQQNCVHAGLQS